MDQPGKVANPARGQLNRENEYFPVPVRVLRIRSRETGSAVLYRVSLLISVLRLNLELTHGIPPDFRGGVHLFILNRHTPSGQFRFYRVVQLRTDGVHCRESAGKGPVALKVVPVTGVALAGNHGSIKYAFVTSVCGHSMPFILDVRLVDAPAGATQEEGLTGFPHLPSAMLALFFYCEKDPAVPFTRRPCRPGGSVGNF